MSFGVFGAARTSFSLTRAACASSLSCRRSCYNSFFHARRVLQFCRALVGSVRRAFIFHARIRFCEGTILGSRGRLLGAGNVTRKVKSKEEQCYEGVEGDHERTRSSLVSNKNAQQATFAWRFCVCSRPFITWVISRHPVGLDWSLQTFGILSKCTFAS